VLGRKVCTMVLQSLEGWQEILRLENLEIKA
jgi:hypothetical protein